MALQNPRESLQWLAINALVIAFLSASQDIVVDAYRTDLLSKNEAAAGAGMNVLGYRVGLILTGSVALGLADNDRLSWPQVYLMLAGVIALVAFVCTRMPEPPTAGRAPQNLREAVLSPFGDFFSRLGARKGASILAFIFLFRLGDFLIGNMTTPFLLRIGFTQTDVAAIQGGVGLAATILGVMAAGVVAGKLGLYRFLWIAGGLQAASNLAYVFLAGAGRNYTVMVGAIIVENVCYGLSTAALVGFLMSLCNPRYSATQYALLSSLVAVSRDILVSPSGLLADALGWRAFFLVSVFAALPGLALLPLFAPWKNNRLQLAREMPREM
jgi:PAT family beta-lactamase induction signal transducer AmpG